MSLPKGWLSSTIGEVFLINPKHPMETDRGQLVSFVTMPAVDEHAGRIIGAVDRVLNDVWSGYTHFAEHDVIFAKITPCMENGKAAVAKGLTNTLACGSTEFYVLRADGAAIPEYLWRYLRQKSFRDDAENHMSGAVGQQRVPRQYLDEHSFPLPPIAEQGRVVAKLDMLGLRLALARADLDRVFDLAKKIRLSALRSVFHFGAEEMPPGWSRRRIDQIAEVQLGRQRSPKDHAGPNMRPYLRAANVTWNGWDLTDVKEMNFTPAEFDTFRLKDGDILLNEGSGSAKEVGKPAVWRGEIADICFQNTLLRVRPFRYHPDLLRYCLLFLALSGQFIANTKGVNIIHIGKAGLAKFVVPEPPEEEQNALLERLNITFARADRLEAEAARAGALLDRLEGAILAKAFKGELVPQDPNEEPASVLLDRVRAKRSEIPKAKRVIRNAAS